MHASHGSTVSVPAANTAGGANGPSTLSRKQRYSSRSNSISSASVVTLKDPISQERQRRQSVAVDSLERVNTNGEGLSNLHRWSHSTNSSVSSMNNVRSRSSSGAVLPAHALSPQKKIRHIVDHSPRPSPTRQKTSPRSNSRRRQSPSSPEARRPSRPDASAPLTALPPLHTTPALTDPNDTESPSTTATVATPSTQSSYGHDYFGDDGVSPRTNAKIKRPVVIRTHTASSLSRDLAAEDIGGPKQDGTRPDRSERKQSEIYEAPPKSKYAVTNDQDGTKVTKSSEDGRHYKRSRTHEKSEKEKKAMLSKALQKANTAVLLDNAQNYEGALEAYSDACRLLQQVMDRSSGAEDKRKLDSIRVTYTNRVEELRQMEAAHPEPSREKSLPTRPMSDESLTMSIGSGRSPLIDENMKGSPMVGTPVTAQAIGSPSLSVPSTERDSFFSGPAGASGAAVSKNSEAHPEVVRSEPVPPSLLTTPAVPDGQSVARSIPAATEDDLTVMGGRKAATPAPLNVDGLHIPPTNSQYMPAPLSPRRPSPPQPEAHTDTSANDVLAETGAQPSTDQAQVEDVAASGSWLDPIDESDSDCAFSVHSRSSQKGLHRKHIRGASGDTDPDFDAAFDAAMETAYNEGFEPDTEVTRKVEPVASRHAQKESLVVPASDIKEILSPTNSYHPGASFEEQLDDEDEERLLDEITSDYAQTFSFDVATKSALPRQSDSSGYSRSTWQSSQVSDRTTAGTSLSTVAENAPSQSGFTSSASLNTMMTEPPQPPPQGSLPKPPSMSQNRTSGVRSRRLSGQQIKQLKIETAAKSETRQRASTFHHDASPFNEEDEEQQEDVDRDVDGSDLQTTVSDQQHEHMLASPPSLDMLSVSSEASRPHTSMTVTSEQGQSLEQAPGDRDGLKPGTMRHNQSSFSLREHTVLVASPTEPGPPSAITPMSTTFFSSAARRQYEPPLTSQRANFPSFGGATTEHMTGGAYLFDTSFSSSQLPASPRSPGSQQPSLEPCPDSFLLRPFWLMRAMGLTLTHPKGGFLSTRLFVPREVWQTKGVKLKSIEEKVSSCDLLTAALGRLAGVDTYDADALMEELQNFEEVMERVQTTLIKKLGSDVGVGGLGAIFKDAAGAAPVAPNVQNIDSATSGAEKTKSKESKGYLNSWRKLRNKSSGTPIAGGQASRALHKTAERELPTLQSVPMTSFIPVERRGHKKEARNLTFEGPNREYMGSLARLFEGVQILDQIARQVEDPGLKGSSPTHVGLELSIRHAAEFFGFYVCRFVLADLGTLVDKFVKRGTEWVLA